MAEPSSIHPVWEEKYSRGHAQRYPWDVIVSFVLRNAPRDRPRHEIRIIEVGCGTGSNLWFAAREGFSVAGIDGSPSAIAQAKKRFAEENLTGDLRVGDFTELPFLDNSFDLALDRAALSCVGLSVGRKAVGEIRRVLKSGGLFFFNPYSFRHGSRPSGITGPDGLTLNICEGTVIGAGTICFYDEQQVLDALDGWKVHSLRAMSEGDEHGLLSSIHAEWRVVAECMK